MIQQTDSNTGNRYIPAVHGGGVGGLLEHTTILKVLIEGDYVGDVQAVVELLARRKALLQRPVLIRGDLAGSGPLVATVGRPKERLYEFIGGS